MILTSLKLRSTWPGAVELWRTDDSDDVARLARYRQVVPSEVPLLFRRALISRQQKLAIDKMVEARASRLEAAGLNLGEWGMLDGPDNPYVIGYEGPSNPPHDLVADFLVFGQGTVVLRRQPPPVPA